MLGLKTVLLSVKHEVPRFLTASRVDRAQQTTLQSHAYMSVYITTWTPFLPPSRFCCAYQGSTLAHWTSHALSVRQLCPCWGSSSLISPPGSFHPLGILTWVTSATVIELSLNICPYILGKLPQARQPTTRLGLLGRHLRTLHHLLQCAFPFHSSEYTLTEILAENTVCQWKMLMPILISFLIKLQINMGKETLSFSYTCIDYISASF